MGKYGTDLTGFGAFEGGVNADKGAPLVSTSSDGETALLFGPAAIREIQAGVANGDFSIPPDAAGDTITAENPLPYWTFTDTSSSGAITCALVAESASSSGQILRWSIAASTATNKSAKLTRFVAFPGSYNQAFAYIPQVTFTTSATTTTIKLRLTIQYYKADQTTTIGSAVTTEQTFPGTETTLTPTVSSSLAGPSSAAFALLTLEIITAGTTPASVTTCSVYEINIYSGGQVLVVAEGTAPGLYAQGLITQASGVLTIDAPTSVAIADSTEITGDLTVTGDVIINGNNANWVSRITANAAQSLTNNTLTKITFNTASSTPDKDSYDPQGWFDNANDRITVGQDGFYNITANIGFATNATGRRLVQIFVNGSDRGSMQVTASTAGSTLISVSTNIYLVATDYVEVHALQQSGGALNTANTTGVYPVLSVARVGA